MDNMIAEACVQLMEEMKPQMVKVSGFFDQVQNALKIEVKAVDNDEINNAYLRMFYDIFYYLPMDRAGKRYIYDLRTYTDPTFKSQVHHYHMETAMDVMPDTGDITRVQWNKFIGQLVNMKDGIPNQLQEPGPFIDDFDENKKK